MSNLIQLSVVSATPSSNGGFIVKLQNKSSSMVQTPFGMKTSTKQQTYYMKLDSAPQVGFSAPLDIDLFNVVERSHTIEDVTSDKNGESISLKWLQSK